MDLNPERRENVHPRLLLLVMVMLVVLNHRFLRRGQRRRCPGKTSRRCLGRRRRRRSTSATAQPLKRCFLWSAHREPRVEAALTLRQQRVVPRRVPAKPGRARRPPALHATPEQDRVEVQREHARGGGGGGRRRRQRRGRNIALAIPVIIIIIPVIIIPRHSRHSRVRAALGRGQVQSGRAVFCA